ncbi:hypothetical protein TNCV_327251 [Trichonephila clavipes]|nr:hypothetical protein TNCV_327251 [Trichonephila clavipes]
MITNFFIPELNNHDVQELWLQQDGATCLTARATIDLLKDTFGDRCNVTSPNIESGRHLCWTRHPHVDLAAAAQPLFDPRGI